METAVFVNGGFFYTPGQRFPPLSQGPRGPRQASYKQGFTFKAKQNLNLYGVYGTFR